jgi:hypothetical protein
MFCGTSKVTLIIMFCGIGSVMWNILVWVWNILVCKLGWRFVRCPFVGSGERNLWHIGRKALSLTEGDNLAEELSVPLGDGSGAVNADVVAVVGTHFNDNSSLTPLARILTSLVLDCDMVSWLERWEKLAASGQLFGLPDMSLGIGGLPGFRSLSPLRSRLELAWLEWQEISENSTKDNLSWRQPCGSARSIPVGK